jgi:hypothetical protein
VVKLDEVPLEEGVDVGSVVEVKSEYALVEAAP